MVREQTELYDLSTGSRIEDRNSNTPATSGANSRIVNKQNSATSLQVDGRLLLIRVQGNCEYEAAARLIGLVESK